MGSNVHTSPAQAATPLILEVFRLGAQLLAAGDRLVAPLELTSARWQVLGAVAEAERPMPVAWLARELGLHRQGVQRITNDLIKLGFVQLAPNPHHRRASLVVLTSRGEETFKAAMSAYNPWVERLVSGFSVDHLETARRVATALRERLHSLSEADEQASESRGLSG